MPITNYFDSPEQYMEKSAQLGKALWGAAKQLAPQLLTKKVLIPAGIGLGAAALGGGIAGYTGLTAAGRGARPGDTLSYRIDRKLHSLYDRIKADEQFGQSFAGNLGSGAANALIGLTQDMVTKGISTIKDRMQMTPMRKAIFTALKQEDPILAAADNKTLLEAYHTMANVAPTLSTDKNAVRSFLTEAATTGGGLDFHSIKGIAEAENAVTRAKAGPSVG